MNEVMMYGRWFGLMARLSVPFARLNNALKFFEELHHAYSSRAYHNLRHVEMCLYELDSYCANLRTFWGQPQYTDIELAIWYHDAVYRQNGNDEESSANLAVNRLDMLDLKHMACKVSELIILGTKHGNNEELKREYVTEEKINIMHDVDLAILGETEKIFDDYEDGIMREYAHVPEDIFRNKRADILQGFLDRPRIFRMDYFYEKYEKQARKNLKRSFARLIS